MRRRDVRDPLVRVLDRIATQEATRRRERARGVVGDPTTDDMKRD